MIKENNRVVERKTGVNTLGATSIKVNHRPPRQIKLSKDNIEKEKSKLKANEDFLSPVSTMNFDLSSKELKPDYSLKHRDTSHDTPRKKIGKKKKKKHTVRNVLIILFVLIALGTGAILVWGNDIIAKLTGGRSNIFEAIGAMGSNVRLKADSRGRTNVLIYGTSGYDMQGSEGYGEHDGAQLTDSIMVLSIDQDNDDIAMISLPRDLYVGRTCTSTGKINEVYYCANLSGDDEESGAKALSNTIEDILGLETQYYIHLDWFALIQVVDSIGGITVTLDEDIEDDWTQTFIKAGEPVTLNGERALGLARARHGTTMGDFTRGNSQQKILSAIQQKIVQEGLDLGAVLGLIDAVGDNVRMNFSIEELKTLYLISKDLNLDDMRQIPLIDYEHDIIYVTTAEMNGISYVVPTAGTSDYSQIKEYVLRMTSSDPAVREGAAILVLNGSGINGAAATEKSKLEKEGYTSVDISDAPAGDYPEPYYIYHISGNTPQSADSIAEKYGVAVKSAGELPAGVSQNYDIVIIVGNQQ